MVYFLENLVSINTNKSTKILNLSVTPEEVLELLCVVVSVKRWGIVVAYNRKEERKSYYP